MPGRLLGSVAALLLSSVATAGLLAQDNIIDKGTSGVRESPRFAEPARVPDTDLAARRAEPSYRLLFTPSAVTADGVFVYGATLGFINATAISNIPFQLRFGYRRLDLEEGEDRDRVNLNGQVRLVSDSIFGASTTLAAILDYTRTLDASKKYTLTLAGERSLLGPLTLGLNGSYVQVEPDGGEREDDLVVSTGLVIAPPGRAELSLDYEFENEVAGEDDYSATLTLLVASRPTTTRLVAGIGKHWTAFLTLVFIR